MDVVQAGETVLFRLNDDTTFFSVVDSKTQCHVRKRDFSADLLIGAPYGSVYEAEGGKVQLVESGELLERIDVDTGSGLDNRNTKDTHLSQKLTQGAIVDMKSSGMTGTELISALISNSSTFAAKTSFAQEKYIKKKQLKHVVRFRIERPTAFSICESLVLKVPARMCGLRGDGIGHLLAGANVRYGARALVFDDTGGVVVGAVVERLGGCGLVIVPAEDQCTNPELAHMNKYNLGHLLRPVKGAAGAAATGAAAAGAGAASAGAAAAGPDDGAPGGASADGKAAGAGAAASAAAAPAPTSTGGHRPTFTLATVKYGQLTRWGGSLVTPGTPSAAAAAQEEAAIVAAEAAAWKAKSQATYQQRVAAAAKAAAPSWRKVPAGGAAGPGAGAKRRRVEAVSTKPAAAGVSAAATSAAASSPVPTKRAEGIDVEADAEGAIAGQTTSAEAEAAADAAAGSSSSSSGAAEGGSSAAEPDAEEEEDGDDTVASDAAGSGAGGAGAAVSDPVAKAAKLKAIKEERAARKAAAESSDPSARHRILPARLSEMSKRFLLQEGLDSIIIVSQYHPAPLALAAVRFAAPSAAISIFCRELQPLAETHRQLRALGLATQLHLTETFYRPHQVLPDRTHPEMVMHGAAGYVLRGVVMLHPHAAVYAAQGINAEGLPSPQAAAAAAYAAAKPAAAAPDAAGASASSAAAVSTA